VTLDVDGTGGGMARESLVEAVQRQQLQKREMKLRSASGAEVPTDSRIAPVHVRGRASFKPAQKCACGCGRDLDPRNQLGLSRTCVVGKLQVMWRRATPALRRQLLRLLAEPE
jgi:hypothetical protein